MTTTTQPQTPTMTPGDVQRVATLAHRMMLTPRQAVALPAVLDHCGRAVGLDRMRFVDVIERRPKALDYVAHCARTAAREAFGD